MGYIGNEPTTGHFPVDNFTSSGGSTYTLAKAPASAGAIEVSVQGVLQPTTAYTVSGATLTMAGVTTGVKIFVRHLGETLSLPTPADGSVTTAKLGVNSVDGTKIAMGSDARGDILYHGATDYARLAKGTSGQVLTMGANDPAWATAAAGGKIGQVLQAKKTDTQSSSTAGTIDITGLSIAITPSATTSKILVTGNIHMAASTFDAVIILFRGATEIGGGAATGSSHLLGVTGGFHRNVYEIGHSAFCHLDTPNTTSATTYKLSWRTDSTVAHYVNRTVTEGSGTAIERVSSDITVWEILA